MWFVSEEGWDYSIFEKGSKLEEVIINWLVD